MEIKSRTIDVCINAYISTEEVYMNYKEGMLPYWLKSEETMARLDKENDKLSPDKYIHQSSFEDHKLLELYKQKNHERIKKMICEKIMNDELYIDYSVDDWDSYDIDEDKIDKDKLYII